MNESTSTTSGARPRILVTGATGAQGGGVVRHLLQRGRFAVRAITRDPSSAKAQALAAAGVEVVQGDLSQPATLPPALAGCHGVFGVTNFWEHFGGEMEQGTNLIEAVAAAGVRHFVFSTLPNVKEVTGGQLEVPHFDIKGKLQELTAARGLPATFVHVAFYFENFIAFFAPRRQPDGSYVISFPQGETPLAGAAVEDVGGVVAAIFERREEFLGRTVYVVGDDQPMDAYAAEMSRQLGVPVRYAHMPREAFAALGFPGAGELADMFEYYRSWVPNRRRELAETRAIFPQAQDFATWLARHREAFAPMVAAPA